MLVSQGGWFHQKLERASGHGLCPWYLAQVCRGLEVLCCVLRQPVPPDCCSYRSAWARSGNSVHTQRNWPSCSIIHATWSGSCKPHNHRSLCVRRQITSIQAMKRLSVTTPQGRGRLGCIGAEGSAFNHCSQGCHLIPLMHARALPVH